MPSLFVRKLQALEKKTQEELKTTESYMNEAIAKNSEIGMLNDYKEDTQRLEKILKGISNLMKNAPINEMIMKEIQTQTLKSFEEKKREEFEMIKSQMDEAIKKGIESNEIFDYRDKLQELSNIISGIVEFKKNAFIMEEARKINILIN